MTAFATRWGTITSISPLRVRLDGEASAQTATPSDLVGNLSIGDKVYVGMINGATVLLGRKGGANAPTYAWAGYTPTVTPDTGAFTTVTPTLRYNVIGGKSVLVKGTITFTTVGTAAGNVTITLPPGLTPSGVGSIGAARLSAGTAGTVIISGSTAVIRKYDGSSPISTSGSSVTIEVTYEIA